MKKQRIKDCSVYKDQTNKQIVARISKIQKLLLHFELKAYAFDPGVRCCPVNSSMYTYDDVDFSGPAWKWLEPLLRELLMYRRKYETVRKGL